MYFKKIYIYNLTTIFIIMISLYHQKIEKLKYRKEREKEMSLENLIPGDREESLSICFVLQFDSKSVDKNFQLIDLFEIRINSAISHFIIPYLFYIFS